MTKYKTFCIFLVCFTAINAHAQKSDSIASLTVSRTVVGTTDLHITATENVIAEDATLNVASEDVFVFFDNVKPNDVYKNYGHRILINGKQMNPKQNCRIVVYRHGAVLMPYPADFKPLTTYTEIGQKGQTDTYLPDVYYTNNPDENAEARMVRPLAHDNDIRSIRLKRGYSATFANEPNGMGYSRVFIADDQDLIIDLPEQIAGKASFIRVCKWQYPSKKGWAGSVWSAAPDGLQYVAEQCDFTNSTWFYNWGTSTGWSTNPAATDSTYNQEFVPEKWGAGEATHKLMELVNTSHLLGYNEPDHTEQSNVSVEKAIEEWPQLLKTGLRLGSPATTNFSWLYEFMSECNKRNYRVDYVVIHAYWGGLGADEWYSKLKEVHEKTGRPLWIKEWNNGANWTKEGWPSGTAEQQQKQLNDLKGILTVMDTCSFVERYSIYNWVQDKRAIILNGKLTPAGEYYAADQPAYFLNRDKEVIPTWRIREAPVLSYIGYKPEIGASFNWTDVNGEMIPGYAVEKSLDGKTFEEIATVPFHYSPSFTDPAEDANAAERAFYRVRSVPEEGNGKASNNVCVNYLQNSEGEQVYAQDILVNEQWTLAKYSYQMNHPFVLLGVPTYRNKVPLSYRMRETDSYHTDVQLKPWQYQEKPSYVNPDTIGVLLIDSDVAEKISAQELTIDVSPEWMHISFNHPFQDTPVVLPSIVSANSSQGASVRVRDITAEGFDIRLQYEEAHPQEDAIEQVNILALLPDTYQLDGWTIRCGITPHNVVSSNTKGGYKVTFEKSMPEAVVFAAMQTANDDVCSVLRIKTRDESSVTFIKDREKSATYTDVQPETVGWLAMVKRNDPLPGDVNEDGTVDINDVVAIINHITGTASYERSNVNGDTDKNGTDIIDINDVVAVINYMAGQ